MTATTDTTATELAAERGDADRWLGVGHSDASDARRAGAEAAGATASVAAGSSVRRSARRST